MRPSKVRPSGMSVSGPNRGLPFAGRSIRRCAQSVPISSSTMKITSSPRRGAPRRHAHGRMRSRLAGVRITA